VVTISPVVNPGAVAVRKTWGRNVSPAPRHPLLTCTVARLRCRPLGFLGQGRPSTDDVSVLLARLEQEIEGNAVAMATANVVPGRKS